MDKSSLELMLAHGLSVERIAKRFGKHPATIAYWVKKHGLEPPLREKYAAKGGIERERLEQLVAAGMSIAQLADELRLSKATVRYWLRRYGLRTERTRRVEAGRVAKDAGLAELKRACPSHGETEFVLEGSGYYRCKRCRAEQVARRRRALKAVLVAEAGGSCCVCGYDRYAGALEFHHLDPEQKRLEINCAGVTLALETLRVEATKCVLLCSNCHAEVEGGVLVLPLEFSPAWIRPITSAGAGQPNTP